MCVCVCVCERERERTRCCVQVFGTPRTVACQAPLSMGFSRQEYWSGLRFFPPGEPEMEKESPALIGVFFTISATWEAL